MSNSKQAKSRSNHPDEVTISSDKKNLVNFESASSSTALPTELNRKIGLIDADLDDLKTDLREANKGVKTKLQDLSEKESDLTSRVSEAYQQLGDLDQAYQSLVKKSSLISKEIKTVSKQLVEVTDKTESEMGSLNSDVQTLIERTEELSEKSRQTTRVLNKSIKDNAKVLRELESQLLTEINALAADSQQRDETLDNKTDKIGSDLVRAEEEIKSSQARLIKMQAVDQALEKRVANIDVTADELTKKSRELSRSTTTLNKRTSELSSAIEELRNKTEEHSGLITDLQDRSEHTDRALFSLIMVEKKHYRTLGIATALLLIGILGFFLYDNANWRAEEQQNLQLQSGVSNNAQQIADSQEQMVELGSKSLQTDKIIQKEITTLNKQLTQIEDQVESLDGRVSNIRPNTTFGKGNVIHSDQWLSQQPAKNYTIHLTTVKEKKQLYKIAGRYHNQLQDELAYLPVTVNQSRQYALVYGNYSSREEADRNLSALPRYVERKMPTVHSMQQVQSYIAN
ncbi:MAG: SPOR domain-containing protein [Candidatus Thiodiazotropha sp. 6PLUC2]